MGRGGQTLRNRRRLDTGECLKVLGLEPGASPQAVKSAYRRAALRVHPDRGGTNEGFIRISAAYQHLVKYGTGDSSRPVCNGWRGTVSVNVVFVSFYGVRVTNTTAS